jgi:hypothetical protein
MKEERYPAPEEYLVKVRREDWQRFLRAHRKFIQAHRELTAAFNEMANRSQR